MRVFDFDRAILRSPAPDVVDGLSAGGGPRPTFEGIATEHRAYAAALEQAGVALTILDPLPGFPDSIFLEDPALVFSEAAILLRPGAPSRAGEAERIEPVLRDLFPRLLRLDEGHADGGDVLVTPGRVFIGLSDRTDAAGANALKRLLAELGREAIVVQPPRETLHLKSGSSLVAEDAVLTTSALAGSGIFAGYRLIVVPEGEEGGANALRVNDHLLVGSGYPRTLDLLDQEGVDLVPLAVSNIARIDAGLTCMSLRWSSDRAR